MKFNYLYILLLFFSKSVFGINKEIETAIINSDSQKIFNLVSGIVSVTSKEKEHYIKIANEEITKALMESENYRNRIKKWSRFIVGLTSSTLGAGAIYLANAFNEYDDYYKSQKSNADSDSAESNKINTFLLKAAGWVTTFLGISEIYKSIMRVDLIKKRAKALAVLALVNRLQINNADS